MIRKDSVEVFRIASDILEATDFMGDVIDGDCCGDIGNESAVSDLENLRARFRSHAHHLQALAFGCSHDEAVKYGNDESEDEK